LNQSSSTKSERASVAIIGGSGLYQMFDGGELLEMSTPYGEPSGPITVAKIGLTSVAFVSRHGRHHEFPPHAVNYRANVWALRELGVRRVLAPCAVGSLDPRLGPGSLVVPDQLVDWTTGRVQTFHDVFDNGPVHAAFADPYCPGVRGAALSAALEHDWAATDGGAMVVIDGPRFATRAESQFFAAQGWLLVNMTGHPEAVLCRELGLCYSPVALVTDLDAGVTRGDGVRVDQVLRTFADNLDRLRAVLITAVDHLPEAACSTCAP